LRRMCRATENAVHSSAHKLATNTAKSQRMCGETVPSGQGQDSKLSADIRLS
jgi:hypothetical protein